MINIFMASLNEEENTDVSEEVSEETEDNEETE